MTCAECLRDARLLVSTETADWWACEPCKWAGYEENDGRA